MIIQNIKTNFFKSNNIQNTKINREQPINFKSTTSDVFVSTIPKITKLNRKNLSEIYPLYLKYRESANVKSSIQEVRNFLKAEMRRTNDRIYAARVNNIPVGFLHAGEEYSTLTGNIRYRIKAMFVDEIARGKGVAKKLIKALKEDSVDTEIIVKARRSNEHSPFLYPKCGFEEDSKFIHFVLPPDKK